MEKRVTCYVSRKNVLTWLTAILMIGSAGLRIALGICGKGADASTVWLQIVLPAAACLIFSCIILLSGKEHFYRTALPVALVAIYFIAYLVQRNVDSGYLMLYILVLAAYVIFYRILTASHGNQGILMFLLQASAMAVLLHGYRKEILAGDWKAFLPNLLMGAALFILTFAIKPHVDGAYHPTWGDRADGRKIRTIPVMTAVGTYFMTRRNGANNVVHDEVEITELEKYIRAKRKEGLTNFGITHILLASYCRCIAKYPATNRFISGQKIYARDDNIVFNMTVKKDMTLEAPDTCIKLHLKASDTVYDVYRKFDAAVQEVKNEPENSAFDRVANTLMLIPSVVMSAVFALLRFLDYFGLVPGFLLEVSPFHGSVYFTSMGSLGMPAITHHLYDFGNVSMFIAFGSKFRRNEVAADGTVEKKKYIDMTINMDERVCDGYYYAAVLKYLRRILANPERLDVPPEKVEKDIP